MPKDWHKAQEKADLKICSSISSALKSISTLINNENVDVKDIQELKGIEIDLINMRERYTK